jgi:hypothetical protein
MDYGPYERRFDSRASNPFHPGATFQRERAVARSEEVKCHRVFRVHDAQASVMSLVANEAADRRRFDNGDGYILLKDFRIVEQNKCEMHCSFDPGSVPDSRTLSCGNVIDRQGK